MKDKRNLLILVLFIIFIGLSIFVYINKNSNTVYLGNFTKINLKDNNIEIKNKNNKISLTKAKIYFNKFFINGYLKSDKSDINNKKNIYNAYNENGKILDFNDDLIAYTGNIKINIANYNELNIGLDKDFEVIDNFLLSDDGDGIVLDYSIDYLDYRKIIFDIDNDGIDEFIYSIDILEGETIDYTYVILIDGDQTILVDKRKGKINNANLHKISFFNLIDFNNDNKYEIVLRLKTGDYGNNYYKIYNYNKSVKEIK